MAVAPLRYPGLMEYPVLLTSGAVRQTVRVETEDGVIGDTVVDLLPGEPGYDEALAEWNRGTEYGWNDGQPQDLPPLQGV